MSTDPMRAARTTSEAPGGVGALVFGIIGLTLLPLVGSIIALVLGDRARERARRYPHRFHDELGRVGRILGTVGLGVFGLFLLLLIVA